MFDQLSAPKPDAILAQLAPFRDDPRPNKMNLGVGVYMDTNGETVVLDSVKQAEQQLLKQQTTKTYVGLAGDMEFNQCMTEIAFGDTPSASRIKAVQAPGGSGALRVLAELIKRMRPEANIWLSDPTWANHNALLQAGGMTMRTYPYFDVEKCTVNFDAMAASLRELSADDIVVFHACCHNPTGANLTNAQWDEVAAITKEVGFLPLFDMAYQGFGDDLDGDAYSVRKFAETVDEMLVAVSCSKNFGLYRDRVGCAFAMGADDASAKLAFDNLTNIARGMYSMPPDHGAAVVRILWQDETLRSQWRGELATMTDRMRSLRQQVSDTFRAKGGGERFDFIADHRGMFSRIGLTEAQVDRLREDHAIYMIGDSRVNIAGLQENAIDRFVEAVLEVA